MELNAQASKPSVITWYKAYCILMAISYLIFSAYLFFLIQYPKDPIFEQMGLDTNIILRMEESWGSILGGTISLTLFFGAALFLPKKSWIWIYGIVAIIIGICNCCCLPLAIPLLIFWLRSDVKLYFGWKKT